MNINEKFPSNSHMVKTETKDEDKKVEKVISGKAVKQKKTLGKRFAETFIEDDARSVSDYIIHDVLIPAAKSMVCDMVGWGGMAEMILFGGNSRGKSNQRKGDGRTHTSYGSYYKSDDRNRREPREMSRMSRMKHDFDDIVLETKGEAEEVLSHLVDLTIDYGQATVADLYDLVGITSNFTDEKYGWFDLSGADSRRVRNGYLLVLPKTQLLD